MRPFQPGFGKTPTVLAGRDGLVSELHDSARLDAPDQRAVLGPRGVGKTVLLRSVEQRITDGAEAVAVWHACDSAQETSQVLARSIIDTTRRLAPWWEAFGQRLASRLSVSVDVVARISLSPRTDDGLHTDTALTATLDALGQAASAARTSVVILLDEIQSLEGSHELVRVSQAIDHTNGRNHPVSVIAAGLYLPEGPVGGGGTFIERFPEEHLGDLSRQETEHAFTGPLALHDVGITADALDYLVNKSQGYPYFVQLYGDAAWTQWRREPSGPITKDTAVAGVANAERKVDSLYRRRFDRLGPLQQQILVTAGGLANERSVFSIGEIAAELGRPTSALSTARASLIEVHQLLEPTGIRGELRFVLPEFDTWAASRGRARLDE